MNVPWDSKASLIRNYGGGEHIEARGLLHQLVGAFLEMAPAQQNGLAIRVSGEDWTREYSASEIRELAARPEFTGARGAFDTADRDDTAECDVEEDTVVAEGVTGPAG